MKLKVAAVHAAPIFMNVKASLEKAIRYIEEAHKKGINLLVFPETFIPGYPYFIECYPPLKQTNALSQYTDCSIELQSSEIKHLQKAAHHFNVAIVMGISERLTGTRTCFNSQVFIDSDGTLLGVHRKLQPTYVERIVWAQGGGNTLKTFRSSLGILGGLACWEHTMNLARHTLITQGEMIHAASWPALSTMSDFELANAQIEAMMKTHALTGQCFVVSASNYVDETCLSWMKNNLGEQNLVKEGGGWSAVIHPFCSFLAGPHVGNKERLVEAEIDLDDIKYVKQWVDSAGHYSRPEILKHTVIHAPLWHDEADNVITGYSAYIVDESKNIKTDEKSS
ncbi:carbon-nitrogen hydrolase family protein [Acinetobacter sp. A47]|uniref:carbon-nitrogen hydrolase family protein n=1 Tax=Acinetobacter sp. A47 TaxID=1561217 RepID=UPI00056FD2CD|nr:carbon-nitrogen hydrolase family protein [Acinetobacter sp. A47]